VGAAKTLLKVTGVSVGALALLGVGGYFGLKAMWADTAGRAPEAATGRRTVPLVATSTTMVVTAHPLATEAGLSALRAGGSALDAAVAVQAALTVVEPQSSGIGGGAFLLYYDASERKLIAYDGRELSPAAATPKLFVHPDGAPFNFVEAVVGGRSVGTPGVLRMLALAHRAHGRRPWAEAFQPGIRLAREGFEITPRLRTLLAKDALFPTIPDARRHFYAADGAAKAVGTRLVNPELARVFEEVAADPEVFYTGPLAQQLVEGVKAAKRPSTLLASLNTTLLEMGAPSVLDWAASEPNGGLLSLEDLRSYKPEVRAPVCIPYKAYRVCGFPPPTSGGVTTLQILGILARFDLSGYGPRSPEVAHLFAEASRVAFADRNRFIADPDYVWVPTKRLLSKDYLDARAALIRVDARAPEVKPGKIKKSDAKAAGLLVPEADDASPELPCTSHLVIRDAEGDIATMTTSVENVFGSRVMVRGFILNNQLTDFSFVPEKNGKPIANAVAPKKRPRSSMAPLLVFDAEGAPVLAIGSPGGSRIIDYVAQATLGILEFGLSPQEAVELPHVIDRGDGPTELEDAGWAPGEREAVQAYLQKLGHTVVVTEENSGLHALQRHAGGWRAGVDPRREGLAAGD
jgi:gamma-glutamyltranspeptidase/glutathione hydrolase